MYTILRCRKSLHSCFLWFERTAHLIYAVNELIRGMFCTNGIRVIKEMKYELPDVPVISIALRLRALMMVTVRRPAVGK